MEMKICPVCSTQNEENFLFCKHCGNALPPTQEPPGTPPPDGQYQQAPPPYGADGPWQQGPYAPPYGPAPEYVDGVPAGDVAAFLGPKNNAYTYKFLQMERTGSGTSFNGVVFVLGFLLGPLFMSLWFFQKKLYKIGALLLAAGAVFSILSAVVTLPFVEQYMDYFAQTQQEILDGESAAGALPAEVPAEVTEAMGGMVLVSLLTGLGGLALTIVCALRANYWYKKRVTSSILKIAAGQGDAAFERLSQEGGNSYIWIAVLVGVIVFNMILAGVMMGPVFDSLSEIVQAGPTI